MTGMQTPATGFRRSLPETVRGIREELEARKQRLEDELAAIDNDLAWVASLEAVATQYPPIHLLAEEAA